MRQCELIQIYLGDIFEYVLHGVIPILLINIAKGFLQVSPSGKKWILVLILLVIMYLSKKKFGRKRADNKNRKNMLCPLQCQYLTRVLYQS